MFGFVVVLHFSFQTTSYLLCDLSPNIGIPGTIEEDVSGTFEVFTITGVDYILPIYVQLGAVVRFLIKQCLKAAT